MWGVITQPGVTTAVVDFTNDLSLLNVAETFSRECVSKEAERKSRRRIHSTVLKRLYPRGGATMNFLDVVTPLIMLGVAYLLLFTATR